MPVHGSDQQGSQAACRDDPRALLTHDDETNSRTIGGILASHGQKGYPAPRVQVRVGVVECGDGLVRADFQNTLNDLVCVHILSKRPACVWHNKKTWWKQREPEQTTDSDHKYFKDLFFEG